MNKFTIPSNSQINIYLNDWKHEVITNEYDIEIIPNSLITINNILAYIVKQDFLKQVSENEYNLYCWEQVHYTIKNGFMYSDLDIDC